MTEAMKNGIIGKFDGYVIDNGTKHVTVKTPKGWKCPRKNCRVDYLHMHSTYRPLVSDEYVFLRTNIGALKDEPATRLTEAEALQLLAVVFKDPQRAINRLKRGDKLETRYATYVAQKV